MDRPMNIIYINPDEMRADALGCYGHPLCKTPNLDRLAAEGTRFDQCHVQNPVCTPSRCSFMTGWYVHTRGHRTLWHCLRPDEPNTLRYLKQNGYDVHWVGKNDLLAQETIPESVTAYHRVDGGHYGPRTTDDPEDPAFMSFLHKEADGHLTDYYRMERAIKVLKDRKPGNNPFMLYLPFTVPHCPYLAPQPWHDMYSPDDIPPLRPTDLPNKPDFFNMIREYRKLDQADDALLRKVMAVYLGMISYFDYLVGMLLDALEETGLADNTAVFFFSDHGDWAGDYGLVEKWPSALDDTLTRVPMIVRMPGGKAGHVVNEPIECFDIMPTTLELAGVEPQHAHYARSMLPQLGGATGDPTRAVFAEGGYDTHEPHCFEGRGVYEDISLTGDRTGHYVPKAQQQQDHPQSVCRATMIRTATHKLIRRPDGVSELYDLQADPLELNNLYDSPDAASVRQHLTEQLLDWYVHTADAVPWNPDLRGVTPELLVD